MHLFPKLPSGTFSHMIIVSVLLISRPSSFVGFVTSFWVLFLVILGTFMEKAAQRNTLEKKTKKGSSSNLGFCGSGGGVSLYNNQNSPHTGPNPDHDQDYRTKADSVGPDSVGPDQNQGT